MFAGFPALQTMAAVPCERNKITPDFEAEIAKARNDLMSEFEDSLMKLRAVETAKVAAISNETEEHMFIP